MDRAGSDGVRTTRRLDAAGRARVEALLRRVAHQDGFWPLSDQLASDLDHPGPDGGDGAGPVFVLAGDADELRGYAQASRREGGWTMQTATAGPDATPALTRTLTDAVVRAVAEAGGGEIDWWVYQATAGADEVAAASGFTVDRDLLQMRRALPADRRSGVVTRSFVVGRDEPAWLTVNNRAFSGHAEQGGWTLDTVRQRMDQPWFDPEGLRLHERDDRLAAFCWTKVHGQGDSSIGEIYVIGVDPDFQGLGLGRELTLAGLDHMVDVGVGQAMLYVDGANAAARALYTRLGFDVSRTDRAYRRDQPARPAQ